jgi:DNA adenine methylase
VSIPHPIPYQGSKRHLAPVILRYVPADVATLIEPFAGSAATILAAAARQVGKGYAINDHNPPLIRLWRAIIEAPEPLAQQYGILWHAQQENRRVFYDRVRAEFNRAGRPDCLLYLLARCVKAAVRYNAGGEFNQSPDNRRLGVRPETMRRHLLEASSLLSGKTQCTSLDYQEVLAQAEPDDLIYLDPPYQGVSGSRDPRYLKSVSFNEFAAVLDALNARQLSYLVSYDGSTGGKVHGRRLPDTLGLRRVELDAGRSSQATLLGRTEATVESLYLSPALVERLAGQTHASLPQSFNGALP